MKGEYMRQYTRHYGKGKCTRCGHEGAAFKLYYDMAAEADCDGHQPSFYECPKCKWGCLDHIDEVKSLGDKLRAMAEDLAADLSGEETDRVAAIFLAELDRHNGNITQAQYEEQIARAKKC